MSKAEVVFSNGSKSMAHNLDDLRERWILKKRRESSFTNEIFDASKEMTYSTPTSVQQAIDWQDEVKHRLGLINYKITTLNAGRNRGDASVNAMRDSVVTEKAYFEAVLSYLKQTVRQYNDAVRDNDETQDVVLSATPQSYTDTKNTLNAHIRALKKEREITDTLKKSLGESIGLNESEVTLIALFRSKQWNDLMMYVLKQRIRDDWQEAELESGDDGE